MMSLCDNLEKVDLFEKVVIKISQKLENKSMEIDAMEIKRMKEN
jgi:hypothetical protein